MASVPQSPDVSAYYTGLGQCDILEMMLYVPSQDGTSSEKQLDLTKSFSEFSLFESITDPTMTGYVISGDMLGLKQLLPLQGGERLEVQFETHTATTKTIKYIGYVYDVSEPARVSEHTQAYRLSFCSEALMLSERTYVQSGFQDTCDAIVKSIYQKFLLGKTNKPLLTVPSSGIQTYTFGTLKPIEAINIVSQMAIGSQDQYGYYFYEDNQQFNFVPIQYLYTQTPVSTYATNYGGNYGSDTSNRNNSQFQSFQKIEVIDNSGYFDRMNDGLYGSDNIYFDLVTKQVVNHHYQVQSEFDQTKSLGQIPDMRVVPDGDDVTYFSYAAGDIDKTQFYVENRMKRMEAITKQYSVLVYGDSGLRAGNVINATFPIIANNKSITANAYDGKWLIQAIRHTINSGVYMQELELSRDAFNKT